MKNKILRVIIMRLIFRRGYICCGCGKRISAGDAFAVFKRTALCNECRSKFDDIPPNSTFEGSDYYDFSVSPFFYDGLYRDIFLKFKFSGFYTYGDILGMAAVEYFANSCGFSEYDCIVPVPLSAKRLRERGFNQTDILFKYISRTLNVPMMNYLERTKHRPAQSTLTGLDRINNIKNVFEAVKPLSGMKIIIADDVLTTGSTINECARVLKEAGAASVCAVTAARVKYKQSTGIYYW